MVLCCPALSIQALPSTKLTSPTGGRNSAATETARLPASATPDWAIAAVVSEPDKIRATQHVSIWRFCPAVKIVLSGCGVMSTNLDLAQARIVTGIPV